MLETEKYSLLISACLAGIPCRYDGRDNRIPAPERDILKSCFILIPVCPEQLGGLSTPRIPSEIQPGGGIVSAEGKDVSTAFRRGAEAALRIAKLSGCRFACMKEYSPSCGKYRVYDGSFLNITVSGKGITVKVFEKNGIKVYNEKEIKTLSGDVNHV
ncbi:MAG: DUF523 domain-containing protein [Candidatus Marinimicrobia bacterium]|nr:DUF523 domain-containing protein [Candidatus Neomarinimicrobiota bacterium]